MSPPAPTPEQIHVRANNLNNAVNTAMWCPGVETRVPLNRRSTALYRALSGVTPPECNAPSPPECNAPSPTSLELREDDSDPPLNAHCVSARTSRPDTIVSRPRDARGFT